MKSVVNKSLFLSIVLTLMVAFSGTAQNATSTQGMTIVTEKEAVALLQTANETVAALNMTSWFSGAAVSVQGVSVQTVKLPSKKEQYLQSGFSTKTLLIRALMKKADRQYNGMA
ncbi:hypothetical protein [Flavobacterium orientale]|uniref:Uncharacterized protein n=1 Tax=Flavobacterium orientale TaxID=1756020 RepID=A0A916XVG3_9FLAO|nr:hypothetical protein [Flavobacterium orientale]GGD14798.1 hypothetical protein GCM10011343_02290 [Flavobacterium orientale]